MEKAGRYEVVANLTKAIDYGIVKVAINDNEPKEFDRFNDGVANDPLVLGVFDLRQGPNRLTVEIVGAPREGCEKPHVRTRLPAADLQAVTAIERRPLARPFNRRPSGPRRASRRMAVHTRPASPQRKAGWPWRARRWRGGQTSMAAS